MNFISGFVEANSYQSVFQLATAITLTYLIGGPAVSNILRNNIVGIRKLRKNIRSIVTENQNDKDIKKRENIVSLLDELIISKKLETVKVTFESSVYYVAVPIFFFLVLIFTSLISCWHVSIANALALLAGFIIFMDPIRVLLNAKDIRYILEKIRYIAQHKNVLHRNTDRLDETIIFLSEVNISKKVDIKEIIRRIKHIAED